MAEEGHGDVAEKASKKQKLESSSPVSISLDREKVQKSYNGDSFSLDPSFEASVRSGSQVKLANMKLKEFLVSAVNTLRSHILPATLAMIDNTLKEPFFHTRYSLKERMVNVRQRGLLEVQKGPISVIYTPSGNVKEIYNDCELVAKDVCHLLNGLSLDTQHPTDALHRSRIAEELFVFNEIDLICKFDDNEIQTRVILSLVSSAQSLLTEMREKLDFSRPESDRSNSERGGSFISGLSCLNSSSSKRGID